MEISTTCRWLAGWYCNCLPGERVTQQGELYVTDTIDS
jgi:hypothetical protein